VSSWWRRYRGRLEVEIALAVVVAVAAFVLAALVSSAARSHVPGALLVAFFLLVIVAVARYGGVLYAVPVGVVTVEAFDWYFLPPTRPLTSPDDASLFVLGLFIVMSLLVATVAVRAGRRAAASEGARGMLAEEQAALRRVATLVARGVQPGEVFAAVAEEIARVLGAESGDVLRYESDGTATTLAASGGMLRVGSTWTMDGDSVTARVYRTGRPARMDDYDQAAGEIAALARRFRGRASVGAPIVIDDRLWGAAVAGSTSGSLPVDAEDRVAKFTELIAIAISNAETRTELTASRARVVAAADETRRRIERDLHDGLQQRLVSLAITVRALETMTPRPWDELRRELSLLGDGLRAGLDELREIARGIHPAVLSDGGLGHALNALARRSVVPIELDVNLDSRLEEHLEVAAYYVASEAITNAVKHAEASVIEVQVDWHDDALVVSIRDDGIGGVDSSRGSGLIGLRDRVEALGGTITVLSPPGAGTTLHVRLPADRDALVMASSAPRTVVA
jgi:signal transduction histidine kinase